MQVLTILKVGSTVEPLRARRGDFEHWFRSGFGLDAEQAPVVAPHLGDALPDAGDVPAVVVTGSASMVTDDEPWSLRCESWLHDVVERGTPVLGVCYGHQLLARAFGGRVHDNPRGREIGTTTVSLHDAGRRHRLFDGLPEELVVQASHTQSIAALPPGASALASNDHDEFQAFALGERAWAVQFHPEFDADIIRGYLSARADQLDREGLDTERLLGAARDSAHGAAILANFLGSLA